MSFYMSEHEIVSRYNSAKDKKEQINILSEMNLVPRAAICEVLKNAGMELPEEFQGGTYHPVKKKRMEWNEKAIAELKKLKEEGLTHLQIAERMGASKLSVDRMVGKVGLTKPRQKKEGKIELKKIVASEAGADVDSQYIKILEEQLKTADKELKSLRAELGGAIARCKELECTLPSSEESVLCEGVLTEARVMKGLAHLAICALKRIKNTCAIEVRDLVDGVLVSMAQIVMSAEAVLDAKEKAPDDGASDA